MTTSLAYTPGIALVMPCEPLIAKWYGDRVERKWQIVGSALRVAATGLCFAQSRPAALTVLTGALVTLGATTLSYNFHAYQSERYPTRVRARATGFVYARRRLSGIFSGFLVAYALRGGGVSATLLLIAACMAHRCSRDRRAGTGHARPVTGVDFAVGAASQGIAGNFAYEARVTAHANVKPVRIAYRNFIMLSVLRLQRHRPVVLAALVMIAGACVPASTAGAADVEAGGAPFLSENDKAMTKMMDDMSIKPTGDVDRDFVAMMAPHHQGAIDMAQAELRYGHNERLRRIAQEIVVEQQQEIVAMRLALGQPLPAPAPAPDQATPASIPAPLHSTSPTHMNMQKEP